MTITDKDRTRIIRRKLYPVEWFLMHANLWSAVLNIITVLRNPHANLTYLSIALVPLGFGLAWHLSSILERKKQIIFNDPELLKQVDEIIQIERTKRGND